VEIDGAPESVGTQTDGPTRERVARSILDNGPSTAAALAQRLDLTPAAVRRHLDHMVGQGTVEARQPRAYGTRGRGRPAKIFALTEAGRDAFGHRYDDLAVQALRFLAEAGGDEAVLAFARRRVAELETAYARIVDAEPGIDPAEALARAMTQGGYAASVRQGPVGAQLCQQHCPVAHVATEFPQLCEAETEVIARVLDRHVQRLATIAHGDGVCTTCIATPAARTTAHSGSHRPTHRTTTTERLSS
jgi:predicted ArsR family transcriptional regulator